MDDQTLRELCSAAVELNELYLLKDSGRTKVSALAWDLTYDVESNVKDHLVDIDAVIPQYKAKIMKILK